MAQRLPEVGGPTALAPGPEVNAALSRLVELLTADHSSDGSHGGPDAGHLMSDRSLHWAVVREAVRRVATDPELLGRARTVRRAAGIAEGLMEAHHACTAIADAGSLQATGGCRMTLLDRVFGSFPYLRNYRQLVDAERMAATALGQTDLVAFCGAGPLPLTGVLWQLTTGAEIVLVEIDPSMAELARGVLELLERHDVIDRGTIRVEVGDAANLDPAPFDLVIVASLVPNPVAVKLGRSVSSLGGDGPLLMARSAVGLTALLAYQPIDVDPILGTGLDHLGTVAPAGQVSNRPDLAGLAVNPAERLLLQAPEGVLNTSEFFGPRPHR